MSSDRRETIISADKAPPSIREAAVEILKTHAKIHDADSTGLGFHRSRIAVVNGHVAGVMGANTNGPDASLLFGPYVSQQSDDSWHTGCQLIRDMVRMERARHVRFAQALSDPSGEFRDVFGELGFHEVASITYLVRACRDVPSALSELTESSGPWQRLDKNPTTRTATGRTDWGRPEWHLEPFEDSHDWGGLASCVKQTYLGSLDCPELNNVRPVADVLQSYAEYESGTRYWYFVRRQATRAGCLLLADHPRQDAMELVYVGLIPSMRGSGGGRFVVQHACQITNHVGRGMVVAGVDLRNEPALRVYAREGFLEFARHSAMYAIL